MNIGYNPHLGYETDVLKGYESMVYKIANKYRIALNAGVDYEDLVSIGTLGLIEAFRNFDPDRFHGKVTSFATYAYPMIQWQIQKFVRDKRHLVRLPRALQSKLTTIRKRGWMNDSAESIAEKTGWKLKETEDALRLLDGWSTSSIDQPMAITYKGDEETSMLDILPSNADFTNVYVQEFVSLLDPFEKVVLRLRMQDLSQGQIAESVGSAQPHVSRILKRIGKKYIQFQAGTLKREGTEMSRGKGSQTLIGSNIEWFVDEVVSTTPTIGLNTQGLHLNTRAVHEIGCKAGQCLQVGFDPEGNRLVVQVANKGLKLRTSSGDKSGGLRLINSRLSAWLKEKQVTSKRYALRVDPSTDLFYIELERHA
ncbi:sigma-70 family RNA polymerase sigma factor [Paenibacillus glucanolyticus]|uniref:sigma-70 family RNA polymerase sigma factor n=1 Tax=Paenibacillus glucanolyticus TaxID=59843 RepID=UPI0030C8F5E9